MKKETEKLVKETVEMATSMNALSVDKINEIAPEIEATTDTQEALKHKAKEEGAIWIKPKRTLAAHGKLKQEWQKFHKRDWEYVCGIFQPEIIGGRPSGEPKTFWHLKWPGDPDCLWEIPVNRKVYVPRMIALYLSGEKDEQTGMESMKYHTFDYVQRPEPFCRQDEFTHQFTPTATQYRGKFIAIGSFS